MAAPAVSPRVSPDADFIHSTLFIVVCLSSSSSHYHCHDRGAADRLEVLDDAAAEHPSFRNTSILSPGKAGSAAAEARPGSARARGSKPPLMRPPSAGTESLQVRGFWLNDFGLGI